MANDHLAAVKKAAAATDRATFIGIATRHQQGGAAYSGKMRLRLAESAAASEAFEDKVKDC
jgi:hypothetical protein